MKPSKYFNKVVWACPECMHVLTHNRTKPLFSTCPKCRKPINPEKFDSLKEFEHCFTVHLAYTSGKIQKPEWHPRYLLHEAIHSVTWRGPKGSVWTKIVGDEPLEFKIHLKTCFKGAFIVSLYPRKYYKPDLQYRDLDGTLHVQDVKSKGYARRKDGADKNFLKCRKIMESIYNIVIEVIE